MFERETQEAGRRKIDEADGSLIERDVPDILDSCIINWSELEGCQR
jgi:hypothetical protein